MGRGVPEEIRVGDLAIRFLLEGEESLGSAAVFEFDVPAGANVAAAHSHDGYEETIYGLEGALTWTIEGTARKVGPGEALCIPRGAVHQFDNTGETDAKALAIVTPGILGPDFFHAVGAILEAAAGGPPDLAAIADVMRRYGLTPAGDQSRSATNEDVGPGVSATITNGEAILQREKREISMLVAREDVTITRARYSPGEQVAGPHVHHEHTDAFYVLEGELTFEIGREAETVAVSSGGFVAAPPGLAHSVRNDGDRHARWLTIHARDGGFAAFMRGVRDGVEVDWDTFAVPSDGGLPASEATLRSVLPN